MTIQQFKTKLKEVPSEIQFSETIQVIEDNYNFTPTKFTNGTVVNEAGINSGSCKLFAFAQLQNLTKEETLFCFGEHYQKVIDTPTENNHQNIRNFIKSGFSGLFFEGNPLKKK